MARARRSRKSKYQKAYQKARKNYLARIKSWERKGYVLPSDYYIERQKPSKRAIERLNKIKLTPKTRQRLGQVNLETGEILKLPKERNQRKTTAVTSGMTPIIVTTESTDSEYEIIDYSDIIISNFEDYIRGFRDDRFIEIFLSWSNDMQAEMGKEQFAEFLEKLIETNQLPDIYDTYDMKSFMTKMSSILQLTNIEKKEQTEILDFYSTMYSEYYW